MVETHYCTEHDTIFFKKGAMRGYAHPILDKKGKPTGKWCNEEEKKQPEETEEEDTGQRENAIMSKEDWAEKDKITRKSIERQKALELATNWAIALLNSTDFTKKDSLSSRSIIMAARANEEYLATGEIPVVMVIEKVLEGKKPLVKNKLLEEVKKLDKEDKE